MSVSPLVSDAASKAYFWLARGQPEHAWPTRSSGTRARDASPGAGHQAAALGSAVVDPSAVEDS